MKGVELTINTVVMIVLAMLVLIISAFYLTGLFNNFGSTNVDTYVSSGCKIYAETKNDPDKITLGDIDNDGKPDTLLKACQMYLKNPILDNKGCMKLCADKFPGLITEPSTD